MKKKCPCKKVIKHLQGDIKDFKKEADEDKELIRKLKNGKGKSNSRKRRKS